MTRQVSRIQEDRPLTLVQLATAIKRRTRDIDVIELCDRVIGAGLVDAGARLFPAAIAAFAAPVPKRVTKLGDVTKPVTKPNVTKTAGRKPGRPSVSDRPMTPAERKRRSRKG